LKVIHEYQDHQAIEKDL